MEQGVFSTDFSGDHNVGNQIGVNTGSITNHFHTTTQSSQPSPSLIVPFRRDRDFIPRSVLDQIWVCASRPAARVGVVGLGGVGKTQLAIEYAYRRKDEQPQIWVFWVHASSRAKVEESFTQIARQVQILDTRDPEADLFAMVYTWLSNQQNGPWTMVVDNADSELVIFGRCNREIGLSTSPYPLKGYSLADLLPTAAHGSIVITSRSHSVLNGLIEYRADIFELGTMTEADAVALLNKKLDLSADSDQTDLALLANNLEYMPLALTQAASYIGRLSPRMTVLKYLARLTSSQSDRDKLLQQNLRDPRRDDYASSSIIYTWHKSFEHIRQTRDSAARLLSLMSMFHCEAIPEMLLRGRYQSAWDDSSGSSHDSRRSERDSSSDLDLDFEDDIRMLYDYSLIRFRHDEQVFDMHRLVQDSTQKWLQLRGELSQWQERYVSILHTELSMKIGPSNWQENEVLFQHIDVVLSDFILRPKFVLQRADVLYRGAEYALYGGQYDIAKRMAMACVNDRGTHFGLDAEEILSVKIIEAQALQGQGEFENAERLNRYLSSRLESKFGTSHHYTLSCLQSLAQVQSALDKFQHAEQCIRRVLRIREASLGTRHPHTVSAVDTLGHILYQSAKYAEAEPICRRSLTEHEVQLGADHPRTLWSKNSLALVLWRQGHFEEAKDMTRQVLTDSDKALGIKHHTTLSAMTHLGWMLQRLQQHQEAKYLLDRAMPLCIEVLGPDHPTTLRCQHWRQAMLSEVNGENFGFTIVTNSALW